MSEHGKQITLRFRTHGGKRKGAGRKAGKGRHNTPHRKRERFSRHCPSHVTLRAAGGLVNFRDRGVFEVVKDVLAAACQRAGFRLVEFSVQVNHIHLIVEAEDWRSLSGGVRGLEIRLARAINRRMGRRGRVFADRYHNHVLRMPRETRNVLLYVLNNFRKHAWQEAGKRLAADWVDPFSSGPLFNGWVGPIDVEVSWATTYVKMPVAPAKTWLLTKGWKRHGPLRACDLPADRKAATAW